MVDVGVIGVDVGLGVFVDRAVVVGCAVLVDSRVGVGEAITRVGTDELSPA
jgi:hypothetical protein